MTRPLTRAALCAAFCLTGPMAFADPVPISAEALTLVAAAGVTTHMGRDAIALAPSVEGQPFSFGAAVLNGVFLKNGTLTYDVQFGETRTFAGVNFRAQDQTNYEEFYIRAHQSGNPDANQYMPRYNGVPSWQLFYGPQFAAPVTYDFSDWTTVKLVMKDALMDVYINDMDTPVMTNALRRDPAIGGIAFWAFNLGGPAWVSNIDVTPDDAVTLKGAPVPDPEVAPGTVTSWNVTAPFDGSFLEGTTELDGEDDAETTPLTTGFKGIANLSKLSGINAEADTVFAKLTLTAEDAVTRKFDLGFSDHARVYLNGRLLYEAADDYGTRDYRFLGTVGLWDSLYLPLEKGENTLSIAVTESVADKTGWAVMGRFEDMSGLTVK